MAEARAHCAAEAGERRVAETCLVGRTCSRAAKAARAHGQQRPGEESETRHNYDNKITLCQYVKSLGPIPNGIESIDA